MIASVPDPVMTEKSGELSFLDPAGVPVSMPATFGPDHPAAPYDAVRSCDVSLGGAWRLVQYRLPVAAAENPDRRSAFEREVGVGVAITRTVADGPYEGLFRAVAGYELDCDEPYVLYQPMANQSLATIGGRTLPVRRRRTLVRELLVALRVLEALGLVHGAIRPATIFRRGDGPQLDRPSGGAYEGAPRRGDGEHLFASPEQRAGTGRADCRDDLWSVAAMAYWLVTGSLVGDGRGPDLSAAPELGRSLGRCLATRAADRPTAVEVLGIMGIRDPLDVDPLPDDGLAPGRAAFDSMMADKRANRDSAR